MPVSGANDPNYNIYVVFDHLLEFYVKLSQFSHKLVNISKNINFIELRFFSNCRSFQDQQFKMKIRYIVLLLTKI